MELTRARAATFAAASTLALASCGVDDSTSAAAGDAAADASDDARPDGPFDARADGADATTDASDASSEVDASDASTDVNAHDASADAPTDARADAGDASDVAAPCPGTAGPTSVRIGAYCIDTTEVTNAQYAQFLGADAGALPLPPAACAANATYVPGGGTWPPASGRDAYPVVAVDWCDAYVYCTWAGKRLCGAIGGGATPYASYADATASGWFAACSRAGALAYPYGATYVATACNGQDLGGGLRPVASLATCVGADPSLYDMSGNVYEWEDSCDANAGTADHCHVRGGGYLTPGNLNLSCAGGGVSIARGDDTFLDVGFRCCGG